MSYCGSLKKFFLGHNQEMELLGGWVSTSAGYLRNIKGQIPFKSYSAHLYSIRASSFPTTLPILNKACNFCQTDEYKIFVILISMILTNQEFEYPLKMFTGHSGFIFCFFLLLCLFFYWRLWFYWRIMLIHLPVYILFSLLLTMKVFHRNAVKFIVYSWFIHLCYLEFIKTLSFSFFWRF